MAKIKLTKNELKIQKDALKMYRRYLPTLTLKKQQLQAEIRTIEEKAIAVREEKRNLEKDFDSWIAVFSEMDAFPEGIITVSNIAKHFFKKFYGHFDRCYKTCFRIVISPVFKVVSVSSLMMHPSIRITIRLPLSLMWRTCTLIIFHSIDKFLWRIF